jgi:galactosamine-6-phosphate isomerase
MQITYCSSYGEMSHVAAALVREALKEKPNLLLCTATGSSPEGLYKELAATAGPRKELFSQMRILKLDEWGGIPENHPVTCEYFLRKKLLVPLEIPAERYISFASDPEDPVGECSRIRSNLKTEGPIDICILGLGANGHLALNEPAAKLEPFCHVAALTKESLQHPMIASLEQKPKYGLTLGMKEILDSRKIIMLVSGKGKKKIAEKFLEGKVSTELPASFLWQHPQVECLVDREIMV